MESFTSNSGLRDNCCYLATQVLHCLKLVCLFKNVFCSLNHGGKTTSLMSKNILVMRAWIRMLEECQFHTMLCSKMCDQQRSTGATCCAKHCNRGTTADDAGGSCLLWFVLLPWWLRFTTSIQTWVCMQRMYSRAVDLQSPGLCFHLHSHT